MRALDDADATCATAAFRAVLVSTYDLGHQPFGLASAAAWLKDAGGDVVLVDLSLRTPDESLVRSADLIAFYLPMHTATRLALPVIGRFRDLNADAHFCAFGLYAPLNRDLLRGVGVDSVIGGEFEEPLARLAGNLKQSRAEGYPSTDPPIVLARQAFKLPDRAGLPALSEYAFLTMPDGQRRQVGYTEATRGCKHVCRHCPIVPVYEGRFFVVQRGVVMQDIRQQIQQGAEHISFGDPDFFNGPGHSIPLVEQLHQEFSGVSYDVTIKIEHLLKYADLLPVLRSTGCLFVTSAVESVDDGVLELLAKGHTRADFKRAVDACRRAGLVLCPTFIAFTPWMTLAGYQHLLHAIDELDLIEHVAPVQLAIRLLVPAGSRLLELPEIHEWLEPFDAQALCHPWRHPDPRVDALHAQVNAIAQDAAVRGCGRSQVFAAIRACTDGMISRASAGIVPSARNAVFQRAVPWPVPSMSEPWYCCAEPVGRQRSAY